MNKNKKLLKDFDYFFHYRKLLYSIGVSYNNIDILRSMWQEPWRKYHTITHLSNLLEEIERLLKEEDISVEEFNILVITAFFHDCVWQPASQNNEDESIKVFEKMAVSINENDKKQIIDIINVTKSVSTPQNKNSLEYAFWMMDNSVIFNSDEIELIHYENLIRQEYQIYDYQQYKFGRQEFLKNWLSSNRSWLSDSEIDNINFLIKYVANYRPNIAIIAGSFNPIHIGHLNIIKKASKIFDKVIIAQGENTDKNKSEWIIDQIENSNLKHQYQFEQFEGLLTDYIEEKEVFCNVTLVRGIRNSTDLSYEVNQLRFLEELKPNIKVVNIVCDKEFEHISSSAIRAMRKLNSPPTSLLASKYTLLN